MTVNSVVSTVDVVVDAQAVAAPVTLSFNTALMQISEQVKAIHQVCMALCNKYRTDLLS